MTEQKRINEAQFKSAVRLQSVLNLQALKTECAPAYSKGVLDPKVPAWYNCYIRERRWP